MINYVNNAYDKVLKPCDAQKFSIIVNSQETEKHILGHRGGDAKAKSKLPALTYMGVFDKTKWQDSLVSINRQSSQPTLVSRRPPKGGGTRKAEFMRPTGLLMLDFDHISRQNLAPLASPQGGKTPTDALDTPVKLWEYIKSRYDTICKDKSSPLGGSEGGSPFALAHITPSGDGLRLVVTRDKGKTIAEGQYHWVQEVLPWLGVNAKCDDVCKDISRLSFAPMKSEILYFNPSLLFGELPNQEDYFG